MLLEARHLEIAAAVHLVHLHELERLEPSNVLSDL